MSSAQPQKKKGKKHVAKKVAKVSFCCAMIPIILAPILSTALIYFFPEHLQHVFFLNFSIFYIFLSKRITGRMPLTDYENVTANDVTSIGRSFYLKGEEGKIGVWHTLPSSLANEYRENAVEPTADEMEHLLTNGNYPIVLYAHGNSFDRTINHRCMLYNVLNDMDFHVIAFDYRGYGDSEGSPTERGITDDARVVYDYAKRIAGKNLVIIWGHSMGTGVSTRLTNELSLEGHPPDGLVLESAFNNLHDVVLNHPFSLVEGIQIGKNIFQPFRYLPDWLIEKFILERFRSVGLTMETDERIKVIKCPILIVHAADDHVIPAFLARKLVADAKTTDRDVEYVEFESSRGYAHKFIYLAEELPEIVNQFVSKCNTTRISQSRASVASL